MKNIKHPAMVILIIALILPSGCSDQTDTLLGPESTHITNATPTLAKETLRKSAEVTTAPSGTYYTDEHGIESIAQVGDELFDNRWIDNIYANDYNISVEDSTRFELETTGTIQITNPVNMEYSQGSTAWYSINDDTTLTADSLRVLGSGSGTIISKEKIICRSGLGSND